MNEHKWCTCAEFNAKTEANHYKHQCERTARLRRLNRRRCVALRSIVRTVALDAAMVGVILMALVTLVTCAVS